MVNSSNLISKDRPIIIQQSPFNYRMGPNQPMVRWIVKWPDQYSYQWDQLSQHPLPRRYDRSNLRMIPTGSLYLGRFNPISNKGWFNHLGIIIQSSFNQSTYVYLACSDRLRLVELSELIDHPQVIDQVIRPIREFNTTLDQSPLIKKRLDLLKSLIEPTLDNSETNPLIRLTQILVQAGLITLDHPDGSEDESLSESSSESYFESDSCSDQPILTNHPSIQRVFIETIPWDRLCPDIFLGQSYRRGHFVNSGLFDLSSFESTVIQLKVRSNLDLVWNDHPSKILPSTLDYLSKLALRLALQLDQLSVQTHAKIISSTISRKPIHRKLNNVSLTLPGYLWSGQWSYQWSRTKANSKISSVDRLALIKSAVMLLSHLHQIIQRFPLIKINLNNLLTIVHHWYTQAYRIYIYLKRWTRVK